MIIRLADDDQMKAVIDKAGPIAMLFVIALGVAVFVIWKSLNKQMKKIDPNLPMGVDDRRAAADARYTEEAVEKGEEQAAKRGEDAQPNG